MKWKLAALSGLFFLPLFYAFANDPLGWKSVEIPRFSQRTVNGVQMLDQNTIVVVGGNETNDSIRSVFVSPDGGQNWNVIIDTAGASWLTAVDFVNTSAGFAVGFDGAVLKTTTGGYSWTEQSVPANVAHRHFNSVFFIDDQTGFIAGGQRANDSIQTILKTTDGGNTWNILRDVPGHWLKSIFFADANNGYAVGEQGVVLRTADGGNNWSQLSLPGNTAQRNFNTVFFLDATTGFIGGGNRSLDSIRTILKTTDGGDNWSIISDNLSPWIRAIYFSNATDGFAVGDMGTVLYSDDSGDSWTQVAIPDTTNDTIRGLNAVHFLNNDFGVVSGQIGKTLVYQAPVPTAPTVMTGLATEIYAEGALLNATVNANGSPTNVWFEYGNTTVSFDSVPANPASLSGNNVTDVSAQITGLDSNTLYYFRVKAVNNNGTNYGAIRQFLAGRNPIPNWDFETWQNVSEFVPDMWISLGANEQVTSYDGSYAVDLKRSQRTEIGAVLYGIPGDNGIHGGVPFPARPDSLVGYFRYDIAAGDSAAILFWMKKNGIFNVQTFYYITGSSAGVFERLSFPIAYNDNNVPDTLIIGITNSNPFSGTPDTSSRLAVDNISFSGTSINVPNPGFENWVTNPGEELTGWTASGSDGPLGLFPPPVTKSTDRQHGNYAARLENIMEGDGTEGRIETGLDRNNNEPTFPVYARHQTLNFYAKYFPENDDSATITIQFYAQGLLVGTGQHSIDTVVPSFTLFSLPVIYHDAFTVPDSAHLHIESGRGRDDLPPKGPSVLYVDNLSFDGFYKGEFTAYAGIDTTICAGAVVSIGGNPTATGGSQPYTYTWSPGGTLSSTDSPNPLAAPASSTTYHVTVTDDNGNSVIDEVVVTVDICGGIHKQLPVQQPLTVYPNPSSDKFYIMLSGGREETIKVALLDISGKEMQQSIVQCAGGICGLTLSADISNGCYLVAVLRQDSRQYGKLLVYR